VHHRVPAPERGRESCAVSFFLRNCRQLAREKGPWNRSKLTAQVSGIRQAELGPLASTFRAPSAPRGPRQRRGSSIHSLVSRHPPEPTHLRFSLLPPWQPPAPVPRPSPRPRTRPPPSYLRRPSPSGNSLLCAPSCTVPCARAIISLTPESLTRLQGVDDQPPPTRGEGLLQCTLRQ
jgi:hypothetical protein